jgi:MFS family permease
MTGGLLLLAFSSALWMVYAAVATTAIGSGMATPTLTGAVSRSVSALEQGTILGASQSFTSLTRILGPVWAGLAFDHAGPGAPYWTAAVVAFAAMALIATTAGPEAVKP